MVDNSIISNELRQITWGGFLHAHAKLVALMDGKLTAGGLISMSWYDVLLTLKRSPGQRLRLSELADRVILSRSGLTRLVDRIESAGYLTREMAAEDRRGAYAVLLSAGDEALRRAWEVYEGLVLEHFGSKMTDAEARTLQEVFSRLLTPQPVESPPIAVRIRRKGR